jgi:hypothetical protein
MVYKKRKKMGKGLGMWLTWFNVTVILSQMESEMVPVDEVAFRT